MNIKHRILINELDNLKRKYRHYQIFQELDKRSLKYYTILDGIPRREYISRISNNRYLLKEFVLEIKKENLRVSEKLFKKL